MVDNDISPPEVEALLTDSEDELPVGWEVRTTDDGKVYYVDHGTKSTQWHHPRSGKRKFLSEALPFGWQKGEDEQGNTLYINFVNKRTTYIDPRLAFSMTEKRKGKVKFDSYSTAMEVIRGRDMTGHVAMVTGGNGGIGYEVVRALALHGCRVVVMCRDMESGKNAADSIRKSQSVVAEIDVIRCDLASFESIRNAAEEFRNLHLPLHLLICNAAVNGQPYDLSEDGIELTFAVNHLGHFYLTQLLTDILCKSSPSRVVVVSSESHRLPNLNPTKFSVSDLPLRKDKYWSIIAYNQSKLCNVLFAFELNRRLAKAGVACTACHPGNLIYTKIHRNSWLEWMIFLLARPFTKSKEQGAATIVYCATAPEMEGIGGLYLNNCCACSPSEVAMDEDVAKTLWDLSERLVAGESPPQDICEGSVAL